MLSRMRSLKPVLHYTLIGAPFCIMAFYFSQQRRHWKDLPKTRDSDHASAYYTNTDSTLVATLTNYFEKQGEFHVF